MLSFVSDCVVLAGKVWFGSFVIILLTFVLMIAAAVTSGVIKIYREGGDK